MTVIGLIVLLVVVGVLINLVPMDATLKNAVVVIIVLVAVLLMLEALGVLPAFTNLRFR